VRPDPVVASFYPVEGLPHPARASFSTLKAFRTRPAGVGAGRGSPKAHDYSDQQFFLGGASRRALGAVAHRINGNAVLDSAVGGRVFPSLHILSLES